MTDQPNLTPPKTWKSGKAEKAWQVMICARDAMRAEEFIKGTAYILTDMNHVGSSLEAQADVLRRFTGDQIADALLAYHERSFNSVRRGLASGNKEGA